MISPIKVVPFFILGILFVPSFAQNNPWTPVARTEAWWHQRHQQFLESSASLGSSIRIVFLGSSLVEYWGREGKSVWDQNYAPLGAINYGIGGDKTEHVLWRIANGELDGLSPKLVVLYIGSNNVPAYPNNDDIVRGVNTVVDKIHEKLPNTNILLVGTFPRADHSPIKPMLQRIRDIDDKLEALVGNDSRRKSHYFDLFWFLAPSSMDRIYWEYYISDGLHLNVNGYRLWQREMNSTFHSLLR